MNYFTTLLLVFVSLTSCLQARIESLVLFTGCPRSGMAYISQVFQKCGLDVRHEVTGGTGIASWLLAVPLDSVPKHGKFYTNYVPGLNQYRFQHIFHQVRDPLKTISSIATDFKGSWQFIADQIPEIDPYHPPLYNAAKFWYYWNLKAEKLAEYTYRVEDIDQAFTEICRRLGYPLDKGILKKVPRNVNSGRVTHRITWVELKGICEPKLYKKIAKMARRYGYKTHD